MSSTKIIIQLVFLELLVTSKKNPHFFAEKYVCARLYLPVIPPLNLVKPPFFESSLVIPMIPAFVEVKPFKPLNKKR